MHPSADITCRISGRDNPARRLCLLGYPIAHSRSPRLFQDLCPYDLLEDPDPDRAFLRFRSGENYVAANVTAPFKEILLGKADSCSRICRRSGATNLLLKTGSGIYACNTDYEAVRTLLADRPGDILVLGCGGAAKAAVLAALDLKRRVWIANRSRERAERFAASLADPAVSVCGLGQARSVFRECRILVDTLPVPIPDAADWDFRERTILEANYAAPFLDRLDKQKETAYLSGLDWLRAQAEPLRRLLAGQPFRQD